MVVDDNEGYACLQEAQISFISPLQKGTGWSSTEENQKNSCTRLELRRLDKDSTRELGAFHSLKLSKKSRRSQESRKDQEAPGF